MDTLPSYEIRLLDFILQEFESWALNPLTSLDLFFSFKVSMKKWMAWYITNFIFPLKKKYTVVLYSINKNWNNLHF